MTRRDVLKNLCLANFRNQNEKEMFDINISHALAKLKRIEEAERLTEEEIKLSLIIAIQNAKTRGEFNKSPALYFIGMREVEFLAQAILSAQSRKREEI